jgi:hypothetical protein
VCLVQQKGGVCVLVKCAEWFIYICSVDVMCLRPTVSAGENKLGVPNPPPGGGCTTPSPSSITRKPCTALLTLGCRLSASV